ncbi:T9SS type A sorting domain-containing protein, partial [Lacinutrix salivirga]
NTLTISSTATITQLQLYNVAGQQVLSQAFTTQLDLATLPNGIYFLKLFDDLGNISVKKLVKQ